ncbi:squamous cell carcinoma antigen recognized by T-cells 3 [Condylostylus longicornis]|uniref:squamous cell carcinoma antigen recognized by T-cells 3 n=1 Tax=Condylostylus longicornis TaxID=2530218 RepID=UPI00244E0EF9|nr:squamous cell carcinoma antigen recognized by T-cells 3 [Condylostylus longicornis]
MSTIPEIDEAEEDALLQSDEDEVGTEEDIQEDMDEDDLSDDEEKDLREYLKLLAEISSNTLNYDTYIKLTQTAHKLGDLEKIRESYNLFANVFPLASDIWLKFISVERNISTSESEINNVVNLFKKALNDYFSTSVALDYAKFLSKVSDEKKVLEIWSELLGTYSLDCYFGKNFFSLYRKYIEQSSLSNEDKLMKVAQSYMRELQIPLYEMENSYIDFKVLYEKNKEKLEIVVDWDRIDKNYKRAKEDLQKMLPYEERLKNLDQKFYQEKAVAYLDYIKMADEELEENIIQVLYERMVTDCCLNENCWLEYIDFILKRDEDGKPEELEDFPVFQQTALDINVRALRNCTWSPKLYIKKLYILEEIQQPKQEVQKAFEKALEAGFDSPEPYVSLWLEYLSYIRRNTDYESESDIEILRKNFDLSWSALGKQWGVLADCNCEILQFWGRLEYGPFRNPEKGKELWDTVMASSDNSSKSALWIEYIHMEMRVNPESARKLFKKSLSFDLDNPYSIVSAWIRFERCNGSQVNLDYCQKYCENFLKDLDSKYKMKSHKGKQNVSEKKGIKRKSFAINEAPVKKAKTDEEIPKKGTELFLKPSTPNPSFKSKDVKEHEDDDIDFTKDHLRIFLSNLDYNLTEEQIKSGLPELKIVNIDLIKAANGRSRGFCYLELSSEEEVKKALSLDRKMLEGRPMYISSVLRDKEKRQKFKYSGGIEPRKVFVKGLPYDITQEELRELFEPFGKISDIRIVYHKSGKPKGIAYIEYENENSASLATLKLDNYELKEHKINVAISAPPPKQSEKSQPFNINKMLGIGSAKSSNIKKPRMSFLIPASVQRNISGKSASNSTNSNGSAPLKTNEDFRKFLNK